MKTPHVWVIETMNNRGRWVSISNGVRLKNIATEERDFYWKVKYPKDQYRIAKYVREKP